MNEDRPDGTGGADAAGQPGEPSPHLDESVRRVTAAGRECVQTTLETGRALRKLVSADLALARSALGRALVWAAVVIVFGATTWLVLIAILITVLNAAGLGWLTSTAIAAAISLAVTALAGWRMTVFFNMAGMHATRRQLARFGLFQEPDEDTDADDIPPGPPPPQAPG